MDFLLSTLERISAPLFIITLFICAVALGKKFIRKNDSQ